MRKTTLENIILYNSCPIKVIKYNSKTEYKNVNSSFIINKSLSEAIKKKYINNVTLSNDTNESNFIGNIIKMMNKEIKTYNDKIKLTQQEKNEYIESLRELYELNILSGLNKMLTNLFMSFEIKGILITEMYPIIMHDQNKTLHVFYFESENKLFNIPTIINLCKLKTFMLCSKINVTNIYNHIIIIKKNKKITHIQKYYKDILKDKVRLSSIIYSYVSYYDSMPKFNNWMNCGACEFKCKYK